MSFFDFNLAKIKDLTLKVKSLLKVKIEKNVDKSTSLVKSTGQTNIILANNSLAKELIKSLSKSRQDNVGKIIEQTQKNIEVEASEKKITQPEAEWLGPFLDNCKDIHAKDLQDIWSKILQGKINGKNNTSIRTMSVLKNISSSEANLFNQLLTYKIGDFVYYEEGKIPREFPTYSEISLLLEIGLIQIRDVLTIIKRSQDVLSEEAFNLSPFFAPNKGYLGRYCGYILFFDFPPNKTTITIPSIVFSKAGREISQFVRHQIDDEYLSYISNFLKSKNLQLKKIKIPNREDLEKFFNIENSFKSVDVLGVELE